MDCRFQFFWCDLYLLRYRLIGVNALIGLPLPIPLLIHFKFVVLQYVHFEFFDIPHALKKFWFVVAEQVVLTGSLERLNFFVGF